MKRNIILTFIGFILILTSCNDMRESFSVTLESNIVKISATEESSVKYQARNHGSTIDVELNGAGVVTISNAFDQATGKGEVTFATDSDKASKETALLRFHDGKNSVEMEIGIVISSSWGVVPGTPTQGE